MKKKGPRKKVKLADFKSWLDGFCSAQNEDWVPNREQWEMIKNKIFNLEEWSMPPQEQHYVRTANPNSSTGMPAGFRLPPHPAVAPVEQPVQAPSSLAPVKRDGKVVTPNIDSSGGYNSGFE